MLRDMDKYTFIVEYSFALPQVALPDYGSGFLFNFAHQKQYNGRLVKTLISARWNGKLLKTTCF